MLAIGGDKLGGKRDGMAVLKKKRDAFPELNDKPGMAWTCELDFYEASVDTLQRPRWAGV